MAAVTRVEGDYSNIMSYFGQMLSIKKLKEFDLHDFHLHYEGFESIIDADNGLKVFVDEFPDSRNLDRITFLKFNVRSASHSFSFIISWEYSEFEGIGNENAIAFLDLMDQSTFRFF